MGVTSKIVVFITVLATAMLLANLLKRWWDEVKDTINETESKYD